MPRPKLEVADVFRRHGEAWGEAQAGHLSRVQLGVMSAIESCRTAALGGHVEQCVACAHTRIAYNSCRNRHCPKCQGSAASAWLAARTAELLPVPYFHVVFTLPAQLGAIAYQNKALVYGLLFKVAAETLTTIAADPKRLGGRLGVPAVLHTWGQTLDHHPHVHCIVPGGGLSPDGARWIPCRSRFFLPVRVLSRLFRRLFLQALEGVPRLRPASVLLHARWAASARGLCGLFGSSAPKRMGGLRQAPICRSDPGSGLSGALHASGRHRQQSVDFALRRPCPLSLEGLSPGWTDEGDDAGCRRVHAPFPAAHAPKRLSAHPVLWPVRERSPGRSAPALPPASRGCAVAVGR